MSGHSGQLCRPQTNVIIAAAQAHGMQMKKIIQTVHVLCGLCSHWQTVTTETKKYICCMQDSLN